MESQSIQNTDMEIKEVVVRIKDTIKLAYPEKKYFSELKNDISKRTKVYDFRLITESIINFLPVPNLIDIVEYSEDYKEKIIPAIIIETLWSRYYCDEIEKLNDRDLINKISQIASSIISDVSNLHVIQTCTARLRELDMIDIRETNDPAKIEKMLSGMALKDSRYYEAGLAKLIPTYKSQIDKFNSIKEFRDFFDEKESIDIRFNYSELGKEFLKYADKRWVAVFKIEAAEIVKTSNSYEELIKNRKTIYFHEYKDERAFRKLDRKYFKKLSIITSQMINSEITDDECIKLFDYRIKRQTTAFLKKWLSVTTDDSLSNIRIYDLAKIDTRKNINILIGFFDMIEDIIVYKNSFSQAYDNYVSEYFPKTDPELICNSREKVINMFSSRKSFLDICKLINTIMDNSTTNEIVNRINKIEDIINIIINQIESATITELINGLVVIRFAKNNQKLARTYNGCFFRMDPTFEEVESYKGNLLKNASDYIVDDFNHIMYKRDEQEVKQVKSPSEITKACKTVDINNGSYETKVAAIRKLYEANFIKQDS